MTRLIRTLTSALILVAFAGTAFYRGLTSHSGPARNPSSVKIESSDSAIQAIAHDLEAQTRTLTRPVTVYHWTSKTLDREAAKVRGKSISARFWSATEEMNYGLVGQGVYAARDPVSSSNYGAYGDSTLMVITLPMGTRLLDIRNDLPDNGSYRGDDYEASNRILISDESVELAKASGCTVPKNAHINYSWFKSLPCTLLLRGALRQLSISGTVHRWWGGEAKGCFAEAAAFTLFDESLFTDQTVRAHLFGYGSNQYIDALDEDGKEQLAMILRFAFEQGDHWFREGNGGEITSRLTHPAIVKRAKAVSPENYKAWTSQNIFNCSNTYPEEPVGVFQPFNLATGAPNGDVVIDSATYGSDLKKVEEGNATRALAEICKHRGDCEYKVSPELFGGIMPGVPKSFHVEWACRHEHGTKLRDIPAPADEQVRKISCHTGKIKIVSATYGGNVVEAKSENITALAQQQCSAKSFCRMPGSDLRAEDPMPGAPKSIEIKWHCSAKPNSARRTEIRENEAASLNCWR